MVPAANDNDPHPTVITAAGPAAVEAWEAFATDPTLAAPTRRAYRLAAEHFLMWLDAHGHPLSDLTAGVMRAYYEQYPESWASWRITRAALRRLLKTLADRRVIPVRSEGVSEVGGCAAPRVMFPALSASDIDRLFVRATPVQQQAVVDAAAAALLFDDYHHFLVHCGEAREDPNIDAARCEAVLEVGESYGVTPYSWVPAEQPPEDATHGPTH